MAYFNPNAGEITRRPSRTSRDFEDVFIVSFQAKISWVTVRGLSRVGMEVNRPNVQTYLLSRILPPRRT